MNDLETSIILIDLIESIKTNNIEDTKQLTENLNNKLQLELIGIYDIKNILSLYQLTFVIEEKDSFVYVVNNLKILSKLEQEELLWIVDVNMIKTKEEEKKFILNIINTNLQQVFDKSYSLITLAVRFNDFETLKLIKTILKENNDNGKL